MIYLALPNNEAGMFNGHSIYSNGTNKAASSSFYPEGRNSKAEDLAKIKENQHLEQLKQQKNNNRQQEE